MILHIKYILQSPRSKNFHRRSFKQAAGDVIPVKSYYFLIMFDKVGNLCYKLCEAVGNGDKNLLAVSSAFVWVR